MFGLKNYYNVSNNNIYMGSSFGKKLGSAFAYGSALGFLFYLIGAGLSAVATALPSTTPLIGLLVGFSSAVGIALAKDEHEELVQKQ